MEAVQKAYDPKELVKKLKSKGLDLAEDSAIIVIETTNEWAQESANLGTKPFVDGMVLMAGPPLTKFLKEQADKIDGKEG